jgi:hypothetical protein
VAFVHPKRCLIIDPKGKVVAADDGKGDQIYTERSGSTTVSATGRSNRAVRGSTGRFCARNKRLAKELSEPELAAATTDATPS